MTEFDGLPTLHSPVAIAAFEGWNDAADAATSAVEHLEQLWDAREVTTIDPEEFYDFQVNRPQITLVDGDTRRIEWPGTTILVANPPRAKHDVVLIRGTEPSMRWRTFCESVLEVCHSLGVKQIVLLGALLADVPYNRPLPISGSVNRTPSGQSGQPGQSGQSGQSGESGESGGSGESPEEADPAVTPTRYEGPTGIVGILHDAARRAELDAMSFWVHVPHYANNPPCPKATLSLLHRIEDVLDLPVPVGDLAEESAAWEERVRNAASQDAELAEYLRELEERAGDAGIQPLSGDEIASAFEKYLRRRGGPLG